MTTPLGTIIRTDTANRMDPTSRPTIAHLNQATVPGHNDPNHFPIGILNSGIDFPRSGNNIDNRTGMKPQGPTVTTIPDSNRAKNCSIFESVSSALDIVSRFSPWYVTMKCESENLVEKLRDQTNSKMLSAKIISMLKKFGAKIV